MNRREFAISMAAIAAGTGVTLKAERQNKTVNVTGAHFADRHFEITEYDAAGDGSRPCTNAIQKAIAACTQAGGGHVVIPEGRFLTGAIHLDDNVNLFVSEGATLLFSADPNEYLPNVFTRFEGTECMNYSPFIYAFEKTNVGISGFGTLDGQASEANWWAWKKTSNPDRKTLVGMGDSNVPVPQRVFGEGHQLRPNFVQFYRCKDITLEDFTMKNSPMWELHPVLSSNVLIRRVSIDSHGPNNDGCDPESCDGVLIDSCSFSTGDDCIAVKSGRNTDGRRVNVPCQNVVIQNCTMQDGHGGVSIGSEVSGGIRNIQTLNCHMSSPNLQRALRIKTNSYRGGVIENIVFHNNNIGQVAEAAIEVDFYYEEGPGGRFKPVVRGVDVASISCEKSKHAIYMRGYPDDPISGVKIAKCFFENASEQTFFQNVKDIEIQDVIVNGKPFTAADIKK